MLRRSSLAFRLVVLVVIGVAIVLGVFSISAVLAVQDSIDRTLQGRLVLARTLAEQVDYVLDRDMGRLQSLSFAEGFDLSDGDPEPEQRALRDVYGVEPVRVAHGGTLPIASDFAEFITPSVAVMGFALPGANMHAPNEWIPVSQLEKGMMTMSRLYWELAK